ncbi:MAG: F0F1 ATP synthase subunit A [Acidobacteria bacterium]|nr:F0F1 ATP synthase subunit A [Acidobacteriota bacterium]
MLWFFSGTETNAKAGEHAAAAATGHAAEAGAHHTPAIVELVNHCIGQPVHEFQRDYTKPVWEKFFGYFGTTPEKVFGEYTVENAVPWYTVMFILAAILTIIVVWILKPNKLSEEEPSNTQLTLEAGMLGIRNLLLDNVGPHGLKYFPVIATFGLLILISNLMGLVPGLMSPTASTSVTLALGISSFVYYNYIGIHENGLLGHLKHFAGPVAWLAFIMFPIELISNFVRPVSLGVRLFGNLFGDEQILGTISGLVAWIVPALIMPLSLFVAFMQTFIFVLLSVIYIGEVSHAHHEGGDGHEGHGHEEEPSTKSLHDEAVAALP